MERRELKTATLFLWPLLGFVLFFMLLPVVGTFWVSLWQDVSFLPRKFVGPGNYVKLLGDGQFWGCIRFTLVFTFISVCAEMVLGMVVALVINESFAGRGLLRGVVLLPWAIPSVIGARIWQLIYRYEYGLANQVMQSVAGVSVNWLGDPGGALLSIVVADVWKTTPFVAIILLAGLQTVPEELYEQAKIDGANLLQRFTKVTLPMLRPMLVVALLFRTIDALRIFDVIYVITGGGPGGSTTSISLYGYKYFLLGDFGFGSAVSIVLFVVAFSIAIVYLKVGRFREAVL